MLVPIFTRAFRTCTRERECATIGKEIDTGKQQTGRTTMPFMTIREILAKVEDFHAELGSRLSEAESVAQDGEAKLMLSFLGNHERELAYILSTMERESPDFIGTLNEWVQFDANVDDPRQFLREFEVDPGASPREVLEAANKLDVCLFCLYKGLAKGGSTPRAQRLFARLARMELEHQKTKLSSLSYY
jgi:hypothetical protein